MVKSFLCLNIIFNQKTKTYPLMSRISIFFPRCHLKRFMNLVNKFIWKASLSYPGLHLFTSNKTFLLFSVVYEIQSWKHFRNVFCVYCGNEFRSMLCNIFKVLPEVFFFFCLIHCLPKEHITRKLFFLYSFGLPVQLFRIPYQKGDRKNKKRSRDACAPFCKAKLEKRWIEHDIKWEKKTLKRIEMKLFV